MTRTAKTVYSTPAIRARYQKRYPEVIRMLRDGATLLAIQAATGASHPTIIKIRRLFDIPVPKRSYGARTIGQTIALYTEPYGDGHARWTGPARPSTNGLQHPVLWANGTHYMGRREAFRAHHGRAPEGHIRTGCDEPACIAGAHLTDRTIRTELKDKPRAH